MPKLGKQDRAKLERRHARIQHYGTPELGYADSGLWVFLNYVYTKDSHGKSAKDTIKLLMQDAPEYLVVVFLYMLACPVLAIPKSRQMRLSWATTAFSVWHTMTAPYRHTIYQTKKEDDAYAMVSQGAKNPAAGRMDFIIQHLPGWLADPNIASGRGNLSGALAFSPHARDRLSGADIPWYGSSINAIPQGAHQVRQYTPSLFISDESAFQEEFEASMIALRPAVAGGGKAICISSVDAGSAFNRMVLETRDGEPMPEKIHPDVARGLKAFGLEWPKGLRSWETPSGVWCLETHYSADPAKDPKREGSQWVVDAVKGYVGGFESVGWRTEMEIEYSAGGGEPVFPFIKRGCPIFRPRPSVDEILGSGNIYSGYDDGANNESAFVQWWFDRHGHPWSIFELYEPAEDVGLFVKKMKDSPFWEANKYTVCDPAITAKTQRTASGIRSVNELFSDHGVGFVPGRRGCDVVQARRMISDYWSDKDNPRAFLTEATPNLSDELMGLRWERHISEAVAGRKNAPERIRQKSNHACDATFYLFDTRPSLWVAPIQKPKGMTAGDLLDLADRKERLGKTRYGRKLIATGGWR